MKGMACALAAAAFSLTMASHTASYHKGQPNIILLMADDMGWGDVGFNGNTIIKTPNLDAMAREGIKFTRFYSGGPVCSPTRATCLSGRHYFRHGIWKANVGRLPREEITLPAVLKQLGYATGHFGKWHLGIPNKEYRGKGGGEKNYAFPQWYGYDEHFVTHHAVPLWDPFGPNGEKAKTDGNPYFHNGKRVLENITGDDSRIIMDRVIPFIQDAVKDDKPFLAVIWFHAPHGPVVAGPQYRAMYSEYSVKEQHYYGCITALDEQVGRLQQELIKLNVEQNTMVWFCSDNGPANGSAGKTGGLRGRKRSLFFGGVGVPAFLKWPGHAEPGEVMDMPCSTLDYLPTVMDVVGAEMPDDRPIDGISLLPMIEGKSEERLKAIPFRFHMAKGRMHDSPTISMIKGRYKFLTNLSHDGNEDMLFDLTADRSEQNNIVKAYPELAWQMKAETRQFIESAKESHSGADYGNPSYQPAETWLAVTGSWP